jgi:hypothetical protein
MPTELMPFALRFVKREAIDTRLKTGRSRVLNTLNNVIQSYNQHLQNLRARAPGLVQPGCRREALFGNVSESVFFVDLHNCDIFVEGRIPLACANFVT